MYVEFARKAGGPVSINPALVRHIRPGAEDGVTIVSFDKEDQVFIKGAYDEVLLQLLPRP